MRRGEKKPGQSFLFSFCIGKWTFFCFSFADDIDGNTVELKRRTHGSFLAVSTRPVPVRYADDDDDDERVKRFGFKNGIR